jgi:hypothetical protein
MAFESSFHGRVSLVLIIFKTKKTQPSYQIATELLIRKEKDFLFISLFKNISTKKFNNFLYLKNKRFEIIVMPSFFPFYHFILNLTQQYMKQC